MKNLEDRKDYPKRCFLRRVSAVITLDSRPVWQRCNCNWELTMSTKFENNRICSVRETILTELNLQKLDITNYLLLPQCQQQFLHHNNICLVPCNEFSHSFCQQQQGLQQLVYLLQEQHHPEAKQEDLEKKNINLNIQKKLWCIIIKLKTRNHAVTSITFTNYMDQAIQSSYLFKNDTHVDKENN